MIWNLKFKKDVFLKNVALEFVLLVLKLYPIQVVISLPLWIKLTMGQLLLFFLCNFSSFFSLRRSCPRNQTFFTVIDWQIYFWYSANYNTWRALAILFLICSDLLNCQQKVAKTISKSFSLSNSSQKFFSLFRCMLCTVNSDILSSNRNINSTVRVSTLPFRFVWLFSTSFPCPQNYLVPG